MGVYLDASANEAAAAALLGASINYPMRGAVTWKSIVGTNVAADALSNLASAGVIGGALIVVGEDYGAGRQRHPGAHPFLRAQVLALPLRPAAGPRQPGPHGRGRVRDVRGVEPAGGDQPAHPRGAPPREHGVQGQRAAAHRHARPAGAPVLRLWPDQPPAVDVRAGGAEVRAAAPRRAAVRRRARAERGDSRRRQRRRDHLAGRAHPDGAAGARAARLGRRLWQEPRAHAGAERDPPPRARAAHRVSGGQAARPRARRGHAELHRAGAEGAGLRARLERAHPRQGHGGGPGRVRARGGAGRAGALSRRRCGGAARRR